MSDHLGDTRVTFDSSHGGTVAQQVNDYYPFGMEINSVVSGTKNNYLYNRKELQDGLGQYDYGARFYDPVIARWNVPDPMSEKYYRWSPYNYGANNPINNIDIQGDSLRTTGSQSATNAMQQVAETGMGNNATMSQGKNGQWALSALTDEQQKNMSPQQAELYKTLNTIISDTKTVSFNLVDEKDAISKNIYVGDNGTAKGVTATPGVHTIDMGDIKQFGSTGALTSQGAMGHELSEGFQIQARGTSPNDAHFNTGIPTENAINGTTSHGAVISTAGGTTKVTVPVTVGGATKTVTITFKDGNIPQNGLQNNNR